jgi:hypothetical protein
VAAMPRGRISITVSKDGYATRGSALALSFDTVLNFSLTPS